jgi:crotonobetainyl-CoA:carnitine CoA-transferase CaiB-like acyl-CoA transferase
VGEYAHPRLGAVRQVASPLRLSGHEPQMRPGPERGADTEAVLRELCGYDEERVAAARAGGAFG